jgi:GntR family transcriptional regulator
MPVKHVRVIDGSETVDVVPLYHKVYTILSQQIREGLYNETTPLPGEQQLASQYSVSRVTVRKALQRLEEEGRITRQRGRGTFPTSSQPTTRQRKLIDQLTITTDSEADMLSFDRMTVTPDAAAGLKVAEGTQALRVVRLRRTGRTPFALGHVWIAPKIGAELDRKNAALDSIIEFLSDNGHEFDRVEQRITATVADAPTAAILKVDPGSPLLLVNRQVFDVDGSIAMYLRTLYRPDRYAYMVTVRPEPDNLAPHWVEIE